MFNENTWKDGEKLAKDYMKSCGYKIVYTNFECVGVELDIVAILPKKIQLKQLKKDFLVNIKMAESKATKMVLKNSFKNAKNSLRDLLVVCEVKSRINDKFGKGFESVGTVKQRNMIRGAQYLLRQAEFKGMQVRFDVASVDAGAVNYIENAFVC